MKLNKLLTVSALSLSLALPGSIIAPKNANAYLLVAGAAGMTPANGPWADGIFDIPVLQSLSIVGLCIVLLPFCLLDEKGGNGTSVSTAELAANGYSDAQISLIQQDQNMLVSSLKEKRMQLVVRSDDTKETISSQIKSVSPTVSQTYLDFATASMGLN